MQKIGLTGKVKSLKFEHERDSKVNNNTDFINNEFYFNQNGMISEQRQYSSEGLIHIHSYNYDEKNFLIFKTYFNDSREFVNKSKIENVLNKNGRLLKQS